jgi:type 1 glutamine amidotransferase
MTTASTPFRLFSLLVVAVLGVIAGSAALGAQAKPAKQIVLIAGRPSHPPGMHEFRAGCLLFQKALAGFPGVNVQVYFNGWPTKTVDGQVVDDNAALDKADAVLIYSDGGRNNPAIQGDRIKVIDALAARGVGIGFAHYAVEVPTGPSGDAMHRWIGGFYEDHFSVNPMWKPPFDKFPTHPVTRGVQPFATHDEWYFNMRWTTDPAVKARITPLLVATPSDEVRKGPYVSPKGPYDHIIADSGKAETMMWVYERPDGGRSFGFTGGHTHNHWGDPNQRKVMLNALLWLAKVDVPARGVEDKITEADLSMNLDEKAARRTQ